jgi:hypothetical protein
MSISMPLDIRSEAVNQLAEALAARLAIASPDYARWLPILRNQLKDMNFPESAISRNK